MAAENAKYYDGHLINFSSSAGYPTIYVDGKNILLHRYVWEKHHGKIPKGYQIHHKNKDQLDYSLENLELISEKEHHKHHAVENGLGKGNKGKPKLHQSGFCPSRKSVILWNSHESHKFDSVSDAARFIGVGQVGCISRVLSGQRKTVKGWCCRYC